MSIKDKDRIPSHPPVARGYFRDEPTRFVLMTPAMSTIGALLVFFAVAVVVVVILPTFSMNPEPSQNWAPISDDALGGRAIYLQNGCVYCHSGFTRPQDHFNAAYYLYPRVSEPGDYWKGEPSPNIFGTARTGPDLSQEGGQHPDGWHDAHYWSPRAPNPNSIMPRFNWFTDEEKALMIAYNQVSGGKEAYLRYAAVSVGNILMRGNMGMGSLEKAFPDMVDQLQQSGEYNLEGASSDKSPSGLPWMAVWHMNSFERTYWITKDPLPLTQQNLMRGKTIFLQRCVGCHGNDGSGNGAAAEFLMPKPFDFTSGEMNGPGASDGQLYHRILTAGPGTAMENFGTRLSVEDIWRVVLFLRTIPNGGLQEVVVKPEMYSVWSAPDPMLEYISNHPITDTTSLAEHDDDPFMQAAKWVSPGMAAGDTIMVGGKMPMTLDRLAELIRRTYFDMLSKAYDEAQARGDELPARDSIMSIDGVEWHAP